MKAIGYILLSVLLGLGALTDAAETKHPAILLQEALYEEETAGNLDKAIDLYRQVLQEAADVERLAARATYQLGLCHLKKGDDTAAADYFRKVVSNYPKQTSVVKKAQAELDKIAPEGTDRKVVLPDADTKGANIVLDLATGELLPAGTGQQQLTIFRNLGKGDLVYDRVLICIRGAKAFRIVTDLSGEHSVPLNAMEQIEDMTAYQLDIGNIPGRYLITTAEGKDYEVEILSADAKEMQLSYKIYNRSEYAHQKKTFTIYDNMAIDLDSGAVTATDSKDISNEFDIGWDNDGGGALMVNPKGNSSIIGLAGVKQGNWNGAIQSAKNSLALLENKGSRGIFSNAASFCAVLSDQGNLYIIEITDYSPEKATLNVLKLEESIDLGTPEATIKSFVKAVYDGNLEAAKKCVSNEGHDYDEFMEMLATESNHPFLAMIKAMDANIPVEITSKNIEGDRCKISWYFTLGRVYYIGETKIEKGTHQKFSSYLELVDGKWLIRDI